MNVSDVYAALRTQLDILTGDGPAYPIAWEGTEIDPSYTTFLQPHLLPSESVTNTIGNSAFQRVEGIFQVMVYTLAGGGSKTAELLADALILHFPRNATFASGGVTVFIQKSWRSGASSDGVWYRIPVNIRYWANLTPQLQGD